VNGYTVLLAYSQEPVTIACIRGRSLPVVVLTHRLDDLSFDRILKSIKSFPTRFPSLGLNRTFNRKSRPDTCVNGNTIQHLQVSATQGKANRQFAAKKRGGFDMSLMSIERRRMLVRDPRERNRLELMEEADNIPQGCALQQFQ
jgi:hypothetical protein